MSKLADAMARATRREVRPIGFAAGNRQRHATMLVLARAAGPADAAAAAEQGADALIRGTAASGTDKTGDGAFWGSEAAVKDRAGAAAARQAGADFLVFDDESTAASVLLEEELGFVMRAGLDASDTFLRTVEGLPLDALLVPSLDGPLTVRRTLDLRRVAGLARKALLMPVPAEIDPGDLEALRDCGVIGVIGDGPAAVAALRARVDGLPARREQKERRAVSIAPVMGGSRVAVEEPPDEDDED